MKLHPLALACAAALCAPAFAQSSVSVYGVLDTGVLSTNNVSTSPLGYVPVVSPTVGGSTQLKDGGIGGSYWGIRGNEDLGGGLKAIYQLQGNITVPSGALGGPNSASTTVTFNQFATIGLQGTWGEVKFGRQVSPMYYAMAATDARSARYFGSVLTGLVGVNSASKAWLGNNSNVAFGTIYNDNAIVYNSPNWNGVTAALEYALGNTANSQRANVQESATLMYDANGLKLSALYYNGYGNNLANATTLYTAALGAAAAPAAIAAAGFSPTANTNRLTGLGALYTWNQFTVAGQLLQARNPAHAIMPGGSAALDMWDIGFGWKFAPNVNFTTGYYKIKDKTNVGNTASQFAAGIEYSFSRRTMVYAQFAAVTNHGANMNLGPVYATVPVANNNVHATMIGVRHNF